MPEGGGVVVVDGGQAAAGGDVLLRQRLQRPRGGVACTVEQSQSLLGPAVLTVNARGFSLADHQALVLGATATRGTDTFSHTQHVAC